MYFVRFLFWAALSLGSLHAVAQTSPAAQSLPYSQDFSSLGYTATSYPAGWQGWTISTAPGSSYSTAAPSADRVLNASATAAVNSGNVHNYDGKIGWLNTGSLDLGLVLALNTSGKKNIRLAYDIMTIRNPYDSSTNTRINEVSVQYRIGTSGTFTTITGYEYQNNTVKQIGTVTTPQKSETKTILLPADCDSETVVQIRWVSRQVSGGGSRPSFAVDNIAVDTVVPVANEINLAAGLDATEGVSPVNGTFLLSVNPATAAGISLDYELDGSALAGTDYTISVSGGVTPSTLSSSTGTLSIPAGISALVFTVVPVNDAVYEGTEQIRLKIKNASAPYHVHDSLAQISLLDDECIPIHSIQGTGMTATAGTYTIEGIVTGVFPTLSPAGFYLQEEDADADADSMSSEGIFVVSGSAVAVGDKVRVSGVVSESSAAPAYRQAVISAASLTVVGAALPLPAAALIHLPLRDTNDYERFECMRVRFADTLFVTDNYYLGRYGEVGLSAGGVLYQATQQTDLNDATASGTSASGTANLSAVRNYELANRLRYILLDDGRGTIPTLPFVNSDSTLRIGSRIDSLYGIMGYAYSQYRIQPVRISDVRISHAPRPSLPSVGADANLRVASFNVLNYFNGDGAGGGFPTERGAHTPAEFKRQRDKIISALAAIDADVTGLIEMENDGTGAQSALQDLVSGLNAAKGAGTYGFIEDGASKQTYCTDAIRCAIIYKPARVKPVGAAISSSNTIFNRPPLAQTFRLLSNDSLFSFVINHFKSKGCSGSSGSDEDQADGQGCYNDRRKQQAGALADFIAKDVVPVATTPHVISMGDYNAYFEEDPLDSIRARGYQVLSEAHAFSYLFGGRMGSLDNAFVSSSLYAKVTGVGKWNINSCEPTHLDYHDLTDDGGSDYSNPWAGSYTASPFRSSDHDPVIVGLRIARPATVAGLSAQGPFFTLYPNPATSEVRLRFEQHTLSRIAVVNAVGSVVYDVGVPADASEYTIPVHSLSNGMYYVAVYGTDGVRSVKAFSKAE